MTKPIFDPIFCCACGAEIGSRRERGAVTGLYCGEPPCSYFGPPGVTDSKNALVTALVLDRVPVPVVAVLWGMSRQQVVQVVHDWRKGL